MISMFFLFFIIIDYSRLDIQSSKIVRFDPLQVLPKLQTDITNNFKYHRKTNLMPLSQRWLSKRFRI